MNFWDVTACYAAVDIKSRSGGESSVLHSDLLTMSGYLAAVLLLCLVNSGITYPLIKGKPDDKGFNQFLQENVTSDGSELASRCTAEGFGAVTLDDQGVMHFFRGHYVWTGYRGVAQLINETWEGLAGSVDAAFRLHHTEEPLLHQRTYVFKGSQVWSFFEGRLVDGFPRPISQEFPGIPDNLDAAVECHAGDCKSDSIIFLKDGTAYIYSPMENPPVKVRQWIALGNCTATVRWMERYYCFNGVNFTGFNPVTGEVLSSKILDARDYFMSCPGRGHGNKLNATLMSIKNRCSGRSFGAFTSDDKDRTYGFRDGWYFRLDSSKDGWHAWPMNHKWKTIKGQVDAVFNWENKMYFIQGSQVYIYLTGQMYIPVLGYPKPVLEELGVTEVDAAFTCPFSSELYVIRGNKLRMVDLKESPRVPSEEKTIINTEVDSAMCNTHGIYLFQGPHHYWYRNVQDLVSATELPKAGNVATQFFDC
uniref:Hemopexin n=1 Tax=Leptobrachium leishanense TaxID=445787 RepID=A0A8C5M5N6_9ANUR